MIAPYSKNQLKTTPIKSLIKLLLTRHVHRNKEHSHVSFARGNPPLAPSARAHACGIYQECKAPADSLPRHLSGLGLQQASVRGEIISPPTQRAGLFLLPAYVENTTISVSCKCYPLCVQTSTESLSSSPQGDGEAM